MKNFHSLPFGVYAMSLRHKPRSGQYDDRHIARWHRRVKLPDNPVKMYIFPKIQA
jgi:hypothetical protein